MIDNEKMNDAETVSVSSDSRRAFLGRIAVTGLGVAALGLVSNREAQAATQPKQPQADTGHNYPMPKPHAMTEAQFRMGVIGPAMLSLAASEIAVDKATKPRAKEFANFELREAITVIGLLKDLKTPVPPMDAIAKATLQKIKTAPKGAAFDKVYITAQLANHEFLRDLAEVYLHNSAGQTGMAEVHVRHLAMLMLGVFKEHVVLTKDILGMMA